MKVIITGASGIIGKALTQALHQQEHDVIGLSRNPDRYRDDIIPYLQWDAKSGDGWYSEIDETTVIVNLAGENIGAGRWSNDRKERILNSRIYAGKAVVDAIQRAESKPLAVIQMSAIGYYESNVDKEQTEEDPKGEGFLADVVEEWEKSTDEVDDLGVRRVILRTGPVLTKEGGALPRMALPVKLFVGGKLGDGKQMFPWIHLKDVVGVLLYAMENDIQGVYNLTAPNPVTNKEMTKALGKVFRRPTFLFVPAFVIRILFGEMATVVLDGQNGVPEKLEKAGYKFQFDDVENALRDIYNKY